LTQAIAGTFASTFKPEALLYRRSKGLQDYDERMAILIQVVQGDPYGRFFLPQGAGVAFSHNLYRWNPQIRREDGFARLVWGLGTRAVERVGNDYPHPVALSHPTLQPDDTSEAIRSYSGCLAPELPSATIYRPGGSRWLSSHPAQSSHGG
jgi:phosphoenolpyruvate synthase/pyruvate phosphate dikinase